MSWSSRWRSVAVGGAGRVSAVGAGIASRVAGRWWCWPIGQLRRERAAVDRDCFRVAGAAWPARVGVCRGVLASPAPLWVLDARSTGHSPPTAAHQTGQDAVSGQSMCRFGTVAVLSPDSASRSHRLGTNGTRSGVSMPCRNNRCPRLPTGLWDGGVCTETASRLLRNDNPASSRSRWTAASAQTVNRRTAAEPGSSQDPRTPLPIAALSASTPDNQQPGRQLEHSDCLPHHRGTCDR